MSAVIENTVEISRTPEEVFDYLADQGNEVHWNPDCVLRLHAEADGRTGTGRNSVPSEVEAGSGHREHLHPIRAASDVALRERGTDWRRAHRDARGDAERRHADDVARRVDSSYQRRSTLLLVRRNPASMRRASILLMSWTYPGRSTRSFPRSPGSAATSCSATCFRRSSISRPRSSASPCCSRPSEVTPLGIAGAASGIRTLELQFTIPRHRVRRRPSRPGWTLTLIMYSTFVHDDHRSYSVGAPVRPLRP